MDGYNWKRELWQFFAAAVAYWIRPGVTPIERVGVGAVSLLVVVLVIFT